MEQVKRDFERLVAEIRAEFRAGARAGTQSSLALAKAERLIETYRRRIEAEHQPSRGRVLIDEFRRDIRLL